MMGLMDTDVLQDSVFVHGQLIVSTDAPDGLNVTHLFELTHWNGWTRIGWQNSQVLNGSFLRDVNVSSIFYVEHESGVEGNPDESQNGSLILSWFAHESCIKGAMTVRVVHCTVYHV